MVNISKYHGLGNDFIITDYEQVKEYNFFKMAKDLCNRHTGIGADGLIIVKQNPLEMIYYNSDGSRAEMCGNGIRCFSKYVYDKGITYETNYNIYTLAGIMKVTVKEVNPFILEVNMGRPYFEPSDYKANTNHPIQHKRFSFNDQEVIASSLLLGVPHTVVEVEELDENEMIRVGEYLHTNPIYTEGTNVNFYRFHCKNHIEMQTYERGAGLTLACGTGACATFAQLRKDGLIDQQLKVSLPLGDLLIREYEKDILMSGPAELILEGTVDEEEFGW